MRLHIPDKSEVRKTIAALPDKEARAVWAALQSIPTAFGRPHVPAGLGVRQIRPGLFEARAGLQLRALFVRDGDRLIVRLLGTHDDVRRFLRNC